MARRTEAEYLEIGRRIMPLLGVALAGPSGEALRELALAYDSAADESHVSAEVFLFHKYLLVQACVGVFPEAQVDHVTGGFFAALNERVAGLVLSPERQQAMEKMWQLRAGQFDQSFSHDQRQLLDEMSGSLYWKETISQFCRNVHGKADFPDIWAESNGPSYAASQSVTAVLDQMISGLEEINRAHFREEV